MAHRRLSNLHVRIISLLLVAILPLAVLGVALAVWSYREAVATKDETLRQAAALVAARESALIEGMRQMLATLAALPVVMRLEEPACANALGAALRANSVYSGIGAFRPGEGGLACLADPAALLRREANAPWLRAVVERAAGGEQFAIGAADGVTERVAAASPVAGEEEETPVLVLLVKPGHLGSAGLMVPHMDGTASALLTQTWRPVSFYFSTAHLDWLPTKRPFDARMLASVTKTNGRGSDGRLYVYAAAPVPGTDLFVLSAAPRERIYLEERLQLFVSISFPFALLALAVATAWFAVNRLVLRWIQALRETASAYGAGRLETRAPVPVAMPAEISDLAQSFNTMAARVQERSRDLERALDGKTRLLRELHHRVKNNFQVIASLLALQKRSLGREQKALLRYPEDRVQALATAYRLSYASGEIGRVNLGELIAENVTYMRQSVDISPALLTAEAAADGIDLDLDTAIPLSLLLAELLAGVTDAAKATNRPARVILMSGEEGLVLLVTGPPLPENLHGEAVALSRRLARAFAQQLGGRLEMEEGDPTVARIVFHLPARSEDESGSNP